jgi:hypothetical protein
MAYGTLNIDQITGSGAGSVIINNGTSNVAGFTTGNNLQMLQNGGGIVFNNSSATTNSTLNDYETGTWTPSASSGSGAITSYTSSGTYVKIGKSVTLVGSVVLTNVGTAGNVLNISSASLPFQNGTSLQIPGSCREQASSGYSYYACITGGAGGYIQINNATNSSIVWSNGYQYTFQITYQSTF